MPATGTGTVARRLLSEAEVDNARQITVVNQTFADRYFGPENPIGRTVRFMRFANLPQNQRIENPACLLISCFSHSYYEICKFHWLVPKYCGRSGKGLRLEKHQVQILIAN
jgi:hypothetical protein